MDGEALYDEFGNYIGSEFSSESDDGGETTGEGGGRIFRRCQILILLV